MGVKVRPAKNDYAEYYNNYISKVTGDDPVNFMELHFEETLTFFSSLSDEEAGIPYSEGKWSYKEALGHLLDTERIMSYRALSIARGEKKALPGYEQDDYVRNGKFNSRSIKELIEEFKAVREATLYLFRSLKEDDWSKRGIANNYDVTVLALAYIIAGHEVHHLGVLNKFRN